MHLLFTLATPPAPTPPRGDDAAPAGSTLSDVAAAVLRGLLQRADDFRQQPVSAARIQKFELQLQDETPLLRDVLQRWQGPLPRLCYVTDAGDNETAYYDKVLRRQRQPRTGVKREWLRVVDYYHASERLWVMAEQLFGQGQRGAAWVRKMQKWLKKPGGVNRVLHSAAAFREQYQLRGQKRAALQKASRYLRERMRYLRYAEYRRLGVPLGSGVTEAGCKTVYTQRLKLSGMRWQKTGAPGILKLRVVQLSAVWDVAYARVHHHF